MKMTISMEEIKKIIAKRLYEMGYTIHPENITLESHTEGSYIETNIETIFDGFSVQLPDDF